MFAVCSLPFYYNLILKQKSHESVCRAHDDGILIHTHFRGIRPEWRSAEEPRFGRGQDTAREGDDTQCKCTHKFRK